MKYLYSVFILYFCILILDKLQLLEYLSSLILLLSFLPMAIILSFVFEPIIEGIPLHSRGVKCTIVYFSLFVFIGLFIAIFVPTLSTEFYMLYHKIENLLNDYPHVFSQFKMSDMKDGIAFALSSTMSLFRSISSFMLCYIAAYFISIDKPEINKFILNIFPYLKKYNYFYVTSQNAIFHYIKGISIDLCLLFIMNLISLILFDFEHPFVFSVLITFLNLIPYIGPFIGQFIILIVDFLNTGVVRLELFILLFVIQQVEANFIQPYIFNRMLKLKPIITLCSILVFGYLFGVVGYIIAPILAVIMQLAYQSFVYTNRRKNVGTWENIWYNFEEINDEDK